MSGVRVPAPPPFSSPRAAAFFPMLTTKVKHTIERFGLLKSGDRVVVAVSGGPDSVSLLSVLRALANGLDLTLHIAHLDHLFRGEESANEALFVAGLAKKLNIPATLEKIDVPAFCRERGLSSQAGARAKRYEFLRRVAEETGSSRIATGHTADDQAETFLMRLLRGAGVSGLSAIPPMRGNIIRPLIETTRDDILEYLRRNGLEFMTDPSNAKPVYTRNRVRLEVLPLLKQFNPRIVETLAAEAALLRNEDEAMESCLAELSVGVVRQEHNGVVIARAKFNSLPQAFRRRLFRKAVDLAGAKSSFLSLVRIDEALAFMAAAQTGRAMRLSEGLTVGREYESFIVSALPPPKVFSRPLALPGTTAVPELGLHVETMLIDSSAVKPDDKNFIWQTAFDYDKIKLPVELRTRSRGDWFCPAGMGGKTKKIQDYFVDEKVPQRSRDAVPLLVSGGEVLWVVGFRMDERFLPGAETKRILVVRVRNEETTTRQ